MYIYIQVYLPHMMHFQDYPQGATFYAGDSAQSFGVPILRQTEDEDAFRQPVGAQTAGSDAGVGAGAQERKDYTEDAPAVGMPRDAIVVTSGAYYVCVRMHVYVCIFLCLYMCTIYTDDAPAVDMPRDAIVVTSGA